MATPGDDFSMAQNLDTKSIEELLAAQRAFVLRCMEDAKQCLAFNQALCDKVLGKKCEPIGDIKQLTNQEATIAPPTISRSVSMTATEECIAFNRSLRTNIGREKCLPNGGKRVSEPMAVNVQDELKIPLLSSRKDSVPSLGSSPKVSGRKQLEKVDKAAATPKTMFGGASAPQTLRDRVVQALKQKVYNVESLYKETGWAQCLAKSTTFQNITLFVIACNTVWMAIECDYNKAPVLCEAPLVFQVVDNFFTLYFMFEIFSRFCAFKDKRDAFRDGWFKFDSFLVLLMIWETYIIVAIFLMAGSGINSGGLKNLSIFRLFRLLRLTRVARMARLLRAVPELLVLAKAMVMALRSLGATLTLLLLVIYVFSIMFTLLLSEEQVGIGYFQTIPQTFNTLLMMGVFTEQREFITHMLSGGFIYYILMMTYILVGSYTVLNMLIGVICEVISDVANREREDIMIADLRVKIGTISSLFAQDGVDSEENEDEDEPMVCRSAFVDLLNHEEATQALNSVGVDVIALVELADFIFPKSGKVPLSQFIPLLLQFRGSNTATVKDIVDMRKYVLGELHEFESRVSENIGGPLRKLSDA